MRDFESGGVAVHFFGSAWRGFRESGQVGLVDGAENDQMALGHLHGVFDDFGRGGRFGEIGNPNDQAAAALFREQDAGGAGVIRFGGFARSEEHTSELQSPV